MPELPDVTVYVEHIARRTVGATLDEVRVGTGNLDYGAFLGELNRLPDPPPLMLEHLATEADYAAARDYILKTGRAHGIEFVDWNSRGAGID